MPNNPSTPSTSQKMLNNKTVVTNYLLPGCCALQSFRFHIIRPCLKNADMPKWRVFFRHTALPSLGIHKVFLRKSALSDEKIPRPWAHCPFIKQGLVRRNMLTYIFIHINRCRLFSRTRSPPVGKGERLCRRFEAICCPAGTTTTAERIIRASTLRRWEYRSARPPAHATHRGCGPPRRSPSPSSPPRGRGATPPPPRRACRPRR